MNQNIFHNDLIEEIPDLKRRLAERSGAIERLDDELKSLRQWQKNVRTAWAAYMHDGNDAVVFDDLAKVIQTGK